MRQLTTLTLRCERSEPRRVCCSQLALSGWMLRGPLRGHLSM